MEDEVPMNYGADSVCDVQSDPTNAANAPILSQNSLDDSPLDASSLYPSYQAEPTMNGVLTEAGSSAPSIPETTADPGILNPTTTQLPGLTIVQPLSVSSEDDESTELYDLANTILDECKQAAPIGELDTAILLFRGALDRRPGFHPLHWDSRSNLARALMTRFSYTNQQQDLGEALMMLGEVMRQSQVEIENLVQQRNDLLDGLEASEMTDVAKSILTSFNSSAQLSSLDTAIMHHRNALELRPSPHPDRLSSLDSLARALYAKFRHIGNIADLDEGISLLENAVESCAESEDSRPMMVGVLSVMLALRFDKTGQPEDLQEAMRRYFNGTETFGDPGTNVVLDNATSLLEQIQQSGELSDIETPISLFRKVLPSTQHQRRAIVLHNLATALFMRFGQAGQGEDLDEAISLHREALVVLPSSHPDFPSSLNNLAGVLNTRFGQSEQQEDLDEVIYLHREALALLPSPHPDRSGTLINLADALDTRFGQSGQEEDLDEAICLYREVFALLPNPYPHRSGVLNNLANMLSTRFDQSGQQVDLDEAIYLHREALVLHPSPHPDRSSSLSNLANVLDARFSQSGQQEDLDEAISLSREALSLRPSPHPNRSKSLNGLANVLDTRFGQSGQHEDLDEAIFLNREALALLPSPHPDRSSSLDNLASVLNTRFGQSGQQEDLDEAISLSREALILRPNPHPDRSGSLNNLASVLNTRFGQSGQHEDLNEAISLHREALTLLHGPHPFRSGYLNNLAMTLKTRFGQSGQQEDLDEAISLNREALALRPNPHPGRSSSLNNLASVLNTRFGQSGQQEDLDEAIYLHREALALLPSSHPDRFSHLNNLANVLDARFVQLGQQKDLDEAISLNREALALLSSSHPYRSSSLNNLASVLDTRFSQSGQQEDLDKAIYLYREALTLRPNPHPGRSVSLNNLANVLDTRFEQSGQQEDLDEAVSLYREALALVPSPHPHRSSSLNNLANVLNTRFGRSRQQEDLEEAITMFNASLAALPNGHPDKCIILGNLGKTSMIAHSHTHRSHYLAEAMSAFRTAFQCESSPVSERFLIAKSWAQHAESHRDPSALEAYHAAIGLLPRLAMLGLDLRSRHRALMSGSDGLARNAAACAIRSGQYGEAIELLEEGRAVFWSQALQLRTPMDDLRVVAPQLAQSLTEISFQLERGLATGRTKDTSDSSQHKISQEQEVVHFNRLNKQWLAKVEEVRKIDGFHDFLRPIRLSTLQRAATYSSPIVFLNASEIGCAALILTPSQTEPVQLVPLPDITLVRAQAFTRILQVLVSSGRDGSIPIQDIIQRHADSDVFGEEMLAIADILRSFEDPKEGRGARLATFGIDFKNLLHFLWSLVVQPVVCSLGLKKSENVKLLPHIRWCPTGPFAFLPIHAAGIHGLGNPEGIFDYVVSSYTPTISTLLRTTPSAPTPFKMLVVIESKSLKCTKDELQKIEDRVPNECLVKLGVSGSPATVEAVMSSLRDVSIAHFACHGVQDEANPLDSALILEDGRLEVSRIMGQSISGASLAFLSACQTAKGDRQLPDEAMHLAATLLFAGFRGVVGTMWSIYDQDGPKVADTFYESLLPAKNSGADLQRVHPDTTEAARALHVSVAKLRAEGVSFGRWVPFIHLGI